MTNLHTSEEVFKPVLGYEGIYEISNLGTLVSIKKGFRKVMNPHTTTNGYLRAKLCKDGIQKKHSIHRLVAIAFLDNPLNLPQVNHKKGIKNDNRVTELEWCTGAQNRRHAHDIGLASMDHLINHWKEFHKSGKISPNCKPILQFDLNGRLVKEWPSLKSAAASLGKRSGNITQALQGHRRTAYGYMWKLKSDDTDNKSFILKVPFQKVFYPYHVQEIGNKLQLKGKRGLLVLEDGQIIERKFITEKLANTIIKELHKHQ